MPKKLPVLYSHNFLILLHRYICHISEILQLCQMGSQNSLHFYQNHGQNKTIYTKNMERKIGLEVPTPIWTLSENLFKSVEQVVPKPFLKQLTLTLTLPNDCLESLPCSTTGGTAKGRVCKFPFTFSGT